MAIQLISVKCPACGADLSIESGREFSFCSYCGTKVMIANDNEHIYRTIDEAGIKQAETDRLIRLRELEMEEKESARSRNVLFIAYGTALAFVLVGALICIFNPTAGMWGPIIGAYIALFTFIKSSEKKKKGRKYVSSNEVAISEAMTKCSDKNYNSAVMIFRGAGFTNVTAVPLNDLNMFNMRKNGQVESVSIDCNSDFEEGDIFPKSARVMIIYHSK